MIIHLGVYLWIPYLVHLPRREFHRKKKMVHPSRNALVKIHKHSVLRNASKQTGTLLSNMACPLPNSLDIDTPSASFIRSLQKEMNQANQPKPIQLTLMENPSRLYLLKFQLHNGRSPCHKVLLPSLTNDITPWPWGKIRCKVRFKKAAMFNIW